jgi:DDE superfamily endonuclease/Winged helix-turn helix
VPGSTILDIPQPEQEWRLAQVRHARYGTLLAVHVRRLWAAGRTPTAIAPFLCCARSRVSRSVTASTAHRLKVLFAEPPVQARWLSPSLRRSLLALLTKVPSVYGWCRTRWSCATLGAHLTRQRGIVVSASTMRRWLHGLGWGWKRAQVVARDDDPQRVEKLAGSRHPLEPLGKRAVLLFADDLALHLLPKVGSPWLPKGETVKLVTPGQNQKHYLAGALEPRTGRLLHCTSTRQTTALFRALRDRLEWLYPQAHFTKVYVVGDTSGIHKAKAGERWLAAHPRFELLCLPTSCPTANPIEERPTNCTWSAPQAQQRARHLSSPPADRPDGRGGPSLPSQGGPSVLGHSAA